VAVSKVAIANRALQKLGADRIESLSEDSPNARSMAAVYDITRKAELRRYVWGFAIKRDSIAADGSQTSWGQWNRYSLPNDFLRLIRDDESSQAPDWRIEGQYIVSADSAPLNIRYIADIDDPNFYDSLFVEAFASKLALEVCVEITGSSGRQDRAGRDYDLAIGEAKRIGAIEKEAQQFPVDDWINARL
jgi:hypothetical protein